MPDLRVLSPRLPFRIRARLRAERHVDAACSWLAFHGHEQAAIRIWRACRMI